MAVAGRLLSVMEPLDGSAGGSHNTQYGAWGLRRTKAPARLALERRFSLAAIAFEDHRALRNQRPQSQPVCLTSREPQKLCDTPAAARGAYVLLR